MTFHAYAADLARVHGVERGLLPAVGPATEEVRALMLLERLGELDLTRHDLRRGPPVVVDEILRRINRSKDELVSPADFRAWAEEAVRTAHNANAAAWRRRDLEFALAYEAHDRWLAEAGLEDFGESIVRALTLLRLHPDRLAAAREGARHILVDEFQDTNHAQSELLHLLAAGGESLVVVGDDDQGIYRFRGASAKNLADFRERYPGAPEVRLELNHRSTQRILDAAAAVVAPIPDRAQKRLVALPQASGPEPRFWVAPDEEGQARAVAAEIRRLAAAGVPLHEQAVLMRAVRLEAQPVLAALEAGGHPVPGPRRPRALRAPRGPRRPGLAARADRPGRRPGPPARGRRPGPRPALGRGGPGGGRGGGGAAAGHRAPSSGAAEAAGAPAGRAGRGAGPGRGVAGPGRRGARGAGPDGPAPRGDRPGRRRGRGPAGPALAAFGIACGVGQRAYYATRFLAQKGFRARNLSGGFATYTRMPRRGARGLSG